MNANELMREAIAAFNDTGLSPSQLVAQRAELLAALQGLRYVMNGDKDGDWFICAEAAQIVANADAVLAKVQS